MPDNIRRNGRKILCSVDDLEAGFVVGALLGEPSGGEGLLHGGGDEDTAFTVLR